LNSPPLRLDVVIGDEKLNTLSIKTGKEIILENPDIFICINNTPVYKAKILKNKDIAIAKIIKVFSVKEMKKVKEKYCIEVL